MPLARRDQCPRGPVIVVLALLALEVGVDGVRDELVGAAGIMLVIIAARSLSWPMRAIRSRSPAPFLAANWFPVWRKSWKCRPANADRLDRVRQGRHLVEVAPP